MNSVVIFILQSKATTIKAENKSSLKLLPDLSCTSRKNICILFLFALRFKATGTNHYEKSYECVVVFETFSVEKIVRHTIDNILWHRPW